MQAAELHRLDWENRRRADEIRELQKVRGGRGGEGAGGPACMHASLHASLLVSRANHGPYDIHVRPLARSHAANGQQPPHAAAAHAVSFTATTLSSAPTHNVHAQALSDAHAFLFEERQRLLALQAENDELRLQVGRRGIRGKKPPDGTAGRKCTFTVPRQSHLDHMRTASAGSGSGISAFPSPLDPHTSPHT